MKSPKDNRPKKTAETSDKAFETPSIPPMPEGEISSLLEWRSSHTGKRVATQSSNQISAENDSTFPNYAGLVNKSGATENVREYLELQSAKEIAQLAALMAPQPDTADTEGAVLYASQLKPQAEKLLARQRGELVAAMDLRTLYELAGYLDILDATSSGATNHPLINDPIAGPVIQRISELLSAGSCAEDPEGAFINRNYLKILRDKVESTDTCRPQLPCSIDVAMRYVTDIPEDFPEDALHQVFVDFLRVVPLRTPDQRRIHTEHEKSFSAQSLDQLAEHLADTNIRGKTKEEQNSYYKWMKDVCALFEQARDFREQFSPGKNLPKIVKTEADKSYATYWDKPQPFDTEDRLAWLLSTFPTFWEKHGVTYLANHAHLISEQKGSRVKMRQGTQERDAPEWTERVNAFTEYLREKIKIKPTPSGIDLQWVNRYKAYLLETKPPKLTDKRTVEKVTTFLTVLCRHAPSGEGHASVGLAMLRDLKEVSANLAQDATDEDKTIRASEGQGTKSKRKSTLSFKAMSEQTAVVCLNILRVALGKEPVAVPVAATEKCPAAESKSAKRSPQTQKVSLGKKSPPAKKNIAQDLPE